MNPIDKHFLRMQFRDKVKSTFYTAYQDFFENIMKKSSRDFQKVRAYGNLGDGGNDGFVRDSGVYYQVYAPSSENDALAAKKMRDDFDNLLSTWNNKFLIKEYYFVYNNVFSKSNIPIEEMLSSLHKDFPNIKFGLILNEDLENHFFKLDEADLLDLGFVIDRRQAFTIVKGLMTNYKTDFEKECFNKIEYQLQSLKAILQDLGDKDLLLDFEILEGLYFKLNEDIKTSITTFYRIISEHPNDPRAYLHLAEIYLNEGEFEKNFEFLEKAKKQSCDFWFLKLSEFVRKLRLNEEINIGELDNINIPNEPKIESKYHRLRGLVIGLRSNVDRGIKSINKAIKLNPNEIKNYIAKLLVLKNQLFTCTTSQQRQKVAELMLEEITNIESKFIQMGKRTSALINLYKKDILLLQGNTKDSFSLLQKTFNLLLDCHFDTVLDQMYSEFFIFVNVPKNDFSRLIDQLIENGKTISIELSWQIIHQFDLNGDLFTIGKSFFEQKSLNSFSEFIDAVINKNINNIFDFINGNFRLLEYVSKSLNIDPEFKREIIQAIPDDMQFAKLNLLIDSDDQNIDEAFNIIKQLDFANMEYTDFRSILNIVYKKKDWVLIIQILNKLLENDLNEAEKYQYKLQKLEALMALGNYIEVIKFGEILLKELATKDYLDSENKEILLHHIISACIERGHIDKSLIKKSKDILEKYKNLVISSEFKIKVETIVYSRNGDHKKCLQSFIDGVKQKNSLSQTEYANLFPVIVLTNIDQVKTESLQKIKNDVFVKTQNEDDWYYIGNGNGLDAKPIRESNPNYNNFFEKSPGDIIVFDSIYGSEQKSKQIELIYSIEQYIIWKSSKYFHSLGSENILDGVHVFKVINDEGIPDFSNLQMFFKEYQSNSEPFFSEYCNNNIPLAMLATVEGGLSHAIRRITSENKGFINCIDGAIDEINKQVEIAEKLINEKQSVFIDGTSALLLSEYGLFNTIQEFIPNIKIPRSVLTFLTKVVENFTFQNGQIGHLGFINGNIHFSSLNKDIRNEIISNITSFIKYFENQPSKIIDISSANKSDAFTERNILAELTDATILAIKDNSVVLTDDHLYSKYHEIETGENSPETLSSFYLVRTLYDKNLIPFLDYIQYLSYLSSYRCRFLQIREIDIEKAIFGDENISILHPKSLDLFNFPLTLSEEYGVPINSTINLLSHFFHKMIINDSVSKGIIGEIFIRTLNLLPQTHPKKDIGQNIINKCEFNIIYFSQKSIFTLVPSPNIYIKLNHLKYLLHIV